jgi:aspartyl protease family protein
MSDMPATWKVATVWLLVGLGGVLAVNAWQSSQERARIEVAGGRITLQRAPDGHYHWPGTVNGRKVDFLVDTGATRSALPAELARELSLPVLDTVRSQTAGGQAQGQLVQATLALSGGVSFVNARIVALPALETPLLGMDVLGKLTVRISGQTLTIEPGPGPQPTLKESP